MTAWQHDRWVRNGEIVLILPATVLMLPMAAFAALGMALALVQAQSLGLHGSALFTAMRIELFVIMAFIAGIVGFAALWSALLIPAGTFVRRKALRIGTACGVLLGIASAAYWFWPESHHGRGHSDHIGFSGWAIWFVMLVGPLTVGVHQIIRLISLRAAEG